MNDRPTGAAFDVRAWLESLGLAEYAEAFAANDVGLDLLPQLTAEDLRELGVDSIGHRRRLLAAVASLEPARPAAREAEPQRRQLTVLFADLVGSTAMSAELDPEDLRAVYRSYERACSDAIERFEGHVAQLLGDGVVAYFGHPAAHEDDAERAARAGLELVQRVAALTTPSGAPLEARVGIATGVVVVGDIVPTALGEERPIVGDTPNLAARLQSMAPPGGVVLGDRTRRLLRGGLDLADLGVHDLKGFEEPVQVWQVVAERVVRRREGSSPMVDRVHELATLRRAWRAAKDGEGQVVVVQGQSGIGKSRLVRALLDEAAAEKLLRIRYFCSPYHTGHSLYPVASQLEFAAGIDRADGPDERRRKLETLLEQSGPDAREAAEALGSLVGLEPPAGITPIRRKTMIFEALFSSIGGLAARGPVLVVAENVHWADPTTAEFLEGLAAWLVGHPVLLVLTKRPDDKVDWFAGDHVSAIPLDFLPREDCAEIAGHLAGDQLPATMLESILDNADGVPLFVEELTKNVVESGAGAATQGATRVPATLEDSLLERLDRLGPARSLAPVAAVIGREFSHSFLAAVARLEPDEIREQIGVLLAAGIFAGRESGGDPVYRFNHALVQQAAYGLPLRERRIELHQQVVDVLERTDPVAAERTPEVLAWHCAAAGLPAKAISYWRAAGDRAMAQSAGVEAVANYRQALGLIATLPPDASSRLVEIELLCTLGVALLEVEGVAATEPEAVYERARDLAAEIGAHRERFTALWGLAVVYSGRGEMRRAAETAFELLDIAQAEQDPELELEAHHAAWVYHFFLGQLPQAAEHVAAGRAASENLSVARHEMLFGGHDPGFCARNFEALLAWLDGRHDAAAALADETFALALQLPHLHTRAHCIAWGSISDQLGGRKDALARRIDALRTLADERGFVDFAAESRILGGWLGVATGAVDAGLAEVEDGLELRASAGTEHLMPYLLGVAAAAEAAAGRADRALERLDDALARAERSGERWFEPELRRARARLLLDTGRSASEAVAEATRAAALARAQRSHVFAARAEAELANAAAATPQGPSTRS